MSGTPASSSCARCCVLKKTSRLSFTLISKWNFCKILLARVSFWKGLWRRSERHRDSGSGAAILQEEAVIRAGAAVILEAAAVIPEGAVTRAGVAATRRAEAGD